MWGDARAAAGRALASTPRSARRQEAPSHSRVLTPRRHRARRRRPRMRPASAGSSSRRPVAKPSWDMRTSYSPGSSADRRYRPSWSVITTRALRRSDSGFARPPSTPTTGRPLRSRTVPDSRENTRLWAADGRAADRTTIRAGATEMEGAHWIPRISQVDAPTNRR